MPKSKTRSRSVIAHYNPNSKTLIGKVKEKVHGKKARPIPGSSHRIEKRSTYMGSRVLPEQRIEYLEKQAEFFKTKHVEQIVNKRSEIQSQKDKSEDEIRAEIEKFNKQQVSEKELHFMALRFARFQYHKEKKHFEAWLRGDSVYVYHGQRFPVLTERFLKQTQSAKDFINSLNEQQDIDGEGMAESGSAVEIPGDSPERDSETLRSDSDS